MSPPVLKKTDVLFIDEISMCRIDLFDYVGRVLKKTHPIQVVVVGDFCQLPPVMPWKGSNSVYYDENSSRDVIRGGIYLAGRNAEVNRINSDKLESLNSRLFTYEAESDGDVTEEDKRVAPELLELKVGARVMTTVNDPFGHFFNGSMGTVTELDDDHIFVRIDDGDECEIHSNTWEIIRYEMLSYISTDEEVAQWQQL